MNTKNKLGSLTLIFSLSLITITANSQGTIQTPMGQTISVENN